VQQDTLGDRGRTGDPLYRIRRLLLRTSANLDERSWERLRDGLAAGDIPTVTSPLSGSPESSSPRSTPRAAWPDAKRRLIVFFQHAADADIPELTRLAHTVDRWRDEILAFHTTGGASNGPTEASQPAHREDPTHRSRLAASPTTGADSSSAAACNGLPSPPAESEADKPAPAA
jgi:hypothetical protein